MFVIAIDPGGGTGIATYDTATGLFHSEEAQGFSEACERICYVVEEAHGEVDVVAESYIVTARTAKLTQQTEPLRLLGVTEWVCYRKHTPFTLQQPSARKMATDDKIKALGWYKKTKDMHATDAARHLLVFCLKKNYLSQKDRQKLLQLLKKKS